MNQIPDSMKSRCFFVCLWILTTPFLFVHAEEPPADVLTEVMVAKIRQVSSVRICPNGKLVAYILSVPRPIYTDDDGSAWNELHVVDQGGQSRPFVTGKVDISSVEWTPNGKGISFLA